MQTRHLLMILLALSVASTATVDAGPAQKKAAKGQKLYKWVDKDGVTQFGNAIPPEYASQGGEQISKSGQTLRTIEAEKTPEQLAEMERAKAAAEEARLVAAEAAKRDRMLLGTYPTIADLMRARDTRLQAIEAQTNLASGTVAALERELVKLDKQEQNARKSGKALPEKAQQDKQRIREELLANQRFVLEKQAEAQATRDQFEKDRLRLIELRGGEQ